MAAGLGKFDITNHFDRSARHCRTRAFAARLFAGHPLHQSNADIWQDVARCWEALAITKERQAEADKKQARSVAYVAAQLKRKSPESIHS